MIKRLVKWIKRERYWIDLERREKKHKRNDPSVREAAQMISAQLPDSYISYIRPSCYFVKHGWANAWVDDRGIDIQQVGHFTLEQIGEAVAGLTEQNIFWTDRYGKAADMDLFRNSDIEFLPTIGGAVL